MDSYTKRRVWHPRSLRGIRPSVCTSRTTPPTRISSGATSAPPSRSSPSSAAASRDPSAHGPAPYRFRALLITSAALRVEQLRGCGALAQSTFAEHFRRTLFQRTFAEQVCRARLRSTFAEYVCRALLHRISAPHFCSARLQSTSGVSWHRR